MYERRTVEMYSAKGCEFMYGMCRDIRIRATHILNSSVLSLLSTAASPVSKPKWPHMFTGG
jgi:hypothetical protein